MLLYLVKEALYVNFWQFRRLVTHEDAKFGHLHKILGSLVLYNFGYRLWKFVSTGEMGFDRSFATLFWIIVHASLHVSSFEFILPSKRNKVYNIIWPEMRWHSMVFAYRSLILMFFMWLSMNDMVLSHQAVAYLRGPIVIATMAAADYATWFYKSKSLVDQTDSTMRGNPYPPYVPSLAVAVHNMFYSVSQVLATANILYRGFNAVFLQLLAIQTAPFGMTLVKKGILKQAGWHWTYTVALLINYMYGHMVPDDLTHVSYWTTVVVFSIARFRYNVNKYVLWSLAIAYQWWQMYHNADVYNNLLYYSRTMLVWKP